MKKILLLAVLAAGAQLVNAQDLKKVESFMLLKRLPEAKTEIDKAAADPKLQSKPETIYWKSRIYAEITEDTTLAAKYPNIFDDAVVALHKYEEIDPTLAIAKAQTNGQNAYFALYYAALAKSVKAYNQKNWDEATKYFDLRNDMIAKVIKNKWLNRDVAFDTTGVVLGAYSYQYAKKPKEANRYFYMLADARLGGPDYKDIYNDLLVNAININDEANFKKYLAVAKEVYPKESWDVYESQFIDKNMTLEQKIAYYDKQDAAGALTDVGYRQFAGIFLEARNIDQNDTAKHKWLSAKATDALAKAYGKNNQDAVAAFNVGVLYYNVYIDYDNKMEDNIRSMQALNREASEKPAEKDPKKKAAADAALKAKTTPFREANARLEKPAMDTLDLALQWFEKSYPLLKDKADKSRDEKNIFRRNVDYLSKIYGTKRDKARGKDQKAFDLYEAKYKEYDELYSKL